MSNPRGDTSDKILKYIEQYTLENGYAPCVRDIMIGVGLKSTSTVHGHLVRLEKKGMLKRDSLRPRAMVVSTERQIASSDVTNLPLVGRVAAGKPILATENIEQYLPFSKSILGSGNHFILSVHGNSMINAGINNGDYVIVRQQNTAENGEIVIALVDDSATVKRFFKENGHYRLQPENDTMEPIIVDHVTILGKVISLYRLYA